MALQALKNINRTAAANNEQPQGFPAMLEQFKGEIARALPKHINPDRMARIALTAFRMTPKLGECDPRSVFAAVIQSSQLGLEVGLMGEAHLVPFGNQCQLIPGYTGLMKLARNSGLVQDIYAHEVRMNDTFALKLGMERSLEHEPLTAPGGFPASDEERGEVVGFYAVGVLKDGSRAFVAMGRKEVESIRDGSRGYQAAKKYKKESVWDIDFASMGLKTVIRRICKYLPKSPELATALAMDEKAHAGQGQNLNLNDVIDGCYAPVDVAEEAEEIKEKPPAKPESQPQSARAASKLEKLDKVVVALRSTSTVEALDEVYIRAETDLENAELEVALREYRKCKDAITGKSSLI